MGNFYKTLTERDLGITMSYHTGSNRITRLSSIPTDKALVVATVSEGGEISFATPPPSDNNVRRLVIVNSSMVDIDLSFNGNIKVIGSQTFSVPSGSQECVFYFSDGVNIFAERQLNDVNVSVSVNGGGGSSMRDSYFTIEAVEDTTITLSDVNMEWTADNNIWYKSTSLNPVLSKGERIYVRGNSSLGKITSTGYFKVYGNLASLVYYNGFSDKNDLSGCTCYYIFSKNEKLVDASGLYLPKNANYTSLFSQCKNLIKAMPVIQVGDSEAVSFENMFYECKSLLEAPDMVFEGTKQPNCKHMFSGCTKLKKAKNFTTKYAYTDTLSEMFYNCSSLVSVGSINLEEINGYRLCASMFENCSSLTGVTFSNGNLWIGEKSCENMFRNCTSLTEVKGLSYLSMRNNYACNGMFYGCTSLSSLGNITIYIEESVSDACNYMFYNCISLTKDSFGDSLRLNVNDTNNFFYMFAGCTGMTETPIIYIENNVECGLEGLLHGIITLTKAKIKCGNDYVHRGYYRLFGYTTAKNGVIVTNDVYEFLYGVEYDYDTENDGSDYNMEDYLYFVPDTWSIEQDSSL